MESSGFDPSKTQHADKQKPNSFSQRFSQFRERMQHAREKPLSWDEWKKILIEGRRAGIPEGKFPPKFWVSDGLLDTFHEMLPIIKPGIIDLNADERTVDRTLSGREFARNLVVDPSGTKLLVQKENGGKPKVTDEYSMVLHPMSPGQIGTVHTHPSRVPENRFPSSQDVFNLLSRGQNIEFIVTDSVVTAIFRSDKTPQFPNEIIGKGYLLGMGNAKQRKVGTEGGWQMEDADLEELHIPRYEAPRGSHVFVRQTDPMGNGLNSTTK